MRFIFNFQAAHWQSLRAVLVSSKMLAGAIFPSFCSANFTRCGSGFLWALTMLKVTALPASTLYRAVGAFVRVNPDLEK